MTSIIHYTFILRKDVEIDRDYMYNNIEEYLRG